MAASALTEKSHVAPASLRVHRALRLSYRAGIAQVSIGHPAQPRRDAHAHIRTCANRTGATMMTKSNTEKQPAPREISAEEMQRAAGGKGLTIICIEHKGHTVCRMI
jgi:hypothetical protein